MSWIFLGKVLGTTSESQYEKAEDCILHGIRHFDEFEMRSSCAEGQVYLGELYADNSRRRKALKSLKQAEGMCRDMGMDYWLSRTQAALERVKV